jgi:hypothetical protein
MSTFSKRPVAVIDGHEIIALKLSLNVRAQLAVEKFERHCGSTSSWAKELA